MVPRAQRRHGAADSVDDAHSFVAQRPPRRAGRHVAAEDVQVGSANCGLEDADDGVARIAQDRLRALLPGHFARAMVNQRLHGAPRGRTAGPEKRRCLVNLVMEMAFVVRLGVGTASDCCAQNHHGSKALPGFAETHHGQGKHRSTLVFDRISVCWPVCNLEMQPCPLTCSRGA